VNHKNPLRTKLALAKITQVSSRSKNIVGYRPFFMFFVLFCFV